MTRNEKGRDDEYKKAPDLFGSRAFVSEEEKGISRIHWVGLKPQLFGSVIKMSKLIFATLAF